MRGDAWQLACRTMKQKITVQIAGREYALNVDSQQEEAIRRAVKKLNLEIEELQYNYHGHDVRDILSIVLLSEEKRLVELESMKGDVRNADINKLEELEKSLDNYLLSR